MTGRLEDRVAIVVGAGSCGPGWGNGKAAAVLYAREGAKVFCTDIVKEAAEETRDIIIKEGGEATAFAADAGLADQVASMVETCHGTYERIDILHNNVGVVERGTVVETEEESWDRVHRINLKSIYLSCKHVLPHMEARGKGAIVNISSTSGMRHMGMSYCSYSSTKAAIIHLTRTIAMDYAGKGIRANTVVPGVIHTPLVDKLYQGFSEEKRKRLIEYRNKQIPIGHMGDAWDVANAALFLVSDDAKYITGTEIVVDGGLVVKCL